MKTLLLTSFIVLSLFAFGQPVKSSLSFSDTNEKVVRFYPNPAVSVINFEFKSTDKGYSLQIFSLVGKKVLEVSALSSKTSVLLNDFFRGVYIFQLRDKSGKVVESGKFQVAK
jgi:hypothetical protein